MKVQTGEFSSYTNNMLDEHAKSKVWLWDCGPEEPALPEEPDPPTLPVTDPRYPLEQLRHRRTVKNYEEELVRFDAREREHKHWHTNVRGPVELMMWSTDARDALAHDARAVAEGRQQKLRYYISSRTRGYERIKNLGLPRDVVPGEGHQENIERQLAGHKEFAEILKSDPQFGQEAPRP
jgi:hypothetical protein